MQKRKSKPLPAPKKEVSKILELPSEHQEKKEYLARWAKEEHIPGKALSWFSVASAPEQADFRLISETRGKHRMLMIEPPYKGMQPPPLVHAIYDQLRKDHLSTLKKALLQMWIRSTGDGRFGIVMQLVLRSSDSARAFKTFLSYLERNHPEVLCCHLVQCRPFLPFDPSNPPAAMRMDLRTGFGSEFLPIADTGFAYHILDWTPRCKAAWIEFPQKLKSVIHPAGDDRLLEIHSGSSYWGARLSESFASVDTLDYRIPAKLSAKHNASNASGFHFHSGKLSPEWITGFFSKKESDGKWTILLNPPAGEALPPGVISAIAKSCPERIVFISSDLKTAAQEIKRFRRENYMLRKYLPLDFEPGKPAFEVAFIFVPDRAGILGGKLAQTSKTPKKVPGNKKSKASPFETPHFIQQKSPSRSRKG